MESRGRLTKVVGPASGVQEHDRVGELGRLGSPVASSLRFSAVRFARLSEPTISQLVPAEDATLSDGSAGTRVSVPSTYTPKAATRTTSRTSAPTQPAAPARAAPDGTWPGRTARRCTGGVLLAPAALGRHADAGGMQRVSAGRGAAGGWPGSAARGGGGRGWSTAAPGWRPLRLAPLGGGGHGRRHRAGRAGRRPRAVATELGPPRPRCRSSAHQFARRCTRPADPNVGDAPSAAVRFHGRAGPGQDSSGSPSNGPAPRRRTRARRRWGRGCRGCCRCPGPARGRRCRPRPAAPWPPRTPRPRWTAPGAGPPPIVSEKSGWSCPGKSKKPSRLPLPMSKKKWLEPA